MYAYFIIFNLDFIYHRKGCRICTPGRMGNHEGIILCNLPSYHHPWIPDQRDHPSQHSDPGDHPYCYPYERAFKQRSVLIMTFGV